ncbi:hypothetical protein GGR16_000149 [Chelatococcus caeni]|uniref:Uncharacterized protein n=1 Tax=Chelatococcus caeni TaxID=1348468 RepID=A0A840BRA5_9HYPH|nr:hypothetical protein [Chelatococcus caeni]MBB4015143.1 hypothetical protein [Chelatococcus caeni]
MRKIALALPMLFIAAPALACSQQDVQAKAMELSTGLQQLAASNPQAAVDWSKKATDAQAKAQQASDMGQVCALYDELIAEMKAGQ